MIAVLKAYPPLRKTRKTISNTLKNSSGDAL